MQSNALARRRGPFVPAAIMPAQLADRMRGQPPPEQRLMIAILADAVDCFQSRDRRLCREAEEWIMSDRYAGPFSFQHICSILQLDPTAVRDTLRRKQARHGATREPSAAGQLPA